MRSLFPEFIQEQFNKGLFRGELDAAGMFVDVSGFTSMTEKLMRQGKVGAEYISNILNSTFSPVIEAVYRNGGFITGFAGDAFTAIFPGKDACKPCVAAMEIQDIFRTNSCHETPYGSFAISAKVGISYGQVNWGIPGTDYHRTFFFRGAAIDGCAAAEHHACSGDIILDAAALAMTPVDMLKTVPAGDGGFHRVEKCTGRKNAAPKSPKPICVEVGRLFFPEQLYEQKLLGEFRDIVPVFISFQQPESFEALDKFVAAAIETTDAFGGYFNLVDFGDKGGNMLILFGAPVSYENNVQRAVSFILALKERVEIGFRCGITQGEVYAGFVGSDRRSTYTVLGDRVNLAARFMMKAQWGEIWLSETVAAKVEEQYDIAPLGEYQFKGKTEKIKVFSLRGQRSHSEELSFEQEMIGRDAELKKALEFLAPLKKGRNPGVLAVWGDPGIGKTRLLAAVKKQLAGEVEVLTLAADSILRKSMNPFTTFLERYFEQGDAENAAEKKKRFEKRWAAVMSGIAAHPDARVVQEVTEELIRTKSFLAALIGIEWKDSLYEKLDAKSRFENTLYAVKEFIKALALARPVLLAIDDIQWLDNDSREIIKVLFRQTTHFPFSLAVLGRYGDDGTKPPIDIDEGVTRTELALDRLSADTAAVLSEKMLGARAGDELQAIIMRRSEGNPFFIEQICYYLKTNGLLELRDSRYEAIGGNVDIPQGVNALLISRIDRLSQRLKDGVFTASVLGREIDVSIFSEIMRDQDVSSLLSEGRDERIWTPLSELLYSFRNLLLREAAYDMQLRGRLKALHRIVADAMERAYAAEDKHASEMAFHFERAEERDKTRLYLKKAADFAREHYQNEDAIRFYVKLLDYIDDKVEQTDIRHKLGGVYKLIGKWKEAEESYRVALEAAQELKDVPRSADNMRELGYLLLEKGRYDESRELLDRAFETYRATGGKAGESTVLGYIGLIYYYKGDLDNAIDFFNRRLAIAKELNDRANIMVSYRYLGGVAYYRADYRQAQEYYQQVLGIATELGAELDLAVAKLNLGLSCSYLNDFDNALRYYRESLEVYQKFGSKFYIAYTHNNMGELLFWMGSYEEAITSFKEQRNIAAELGSSRHVAMANNMLGNVSKRQKQYDQAREYYDRALKIATEFSLKNLMCEFLFEKAELLFETGRGEEATPLNNEAIQISEAVGRKDFLFKACLLKERITARTDPKTAAAALEKMLSECKTNDQTATVYYYLAEFTGEAAHRAKALELYDTLFKTAPRAEYRDRIQTLKKN